MNLATLFGGGLFFVATSVVGVRLLFLARRSRVLPELLLGLAFLVGGTLGGVLGPVVVVAPEMVSPRAAGILVLAYCVVGVAGISLYNAFTWRVFRPDARWAAGLVAAILAVGLVLVVGYGLAGVYATGVQPKGVRAGFSAANAVGPVWATIEGFLYYGRMRRRVGLGLGDPVVANRFLLWAIGGLCATTIVLLGLPSIFLDASHPVVRLYLLAVGPLGTIASVAYGLAFFPPRRYAAWLLRTAATR